MGKRPCWCFEGCKNVIAKEGLVKGTMLLSLESIFGRSSCTIEPYLAPLGHSEDARKLLYGLHSDMLE